MSKLYSREFIGTNPECCKGMTIIQILSKNTKTTYCSWCGKKLKYVKDIAVVDQRASK